MNTQTPTQQAAFDTIQRATESRDAGLLTSLYADDATISIVDRTHPPSAPLEMRGKEAIATYLADVYGRDMTHRIEQEVVGADRVSFTEACQYADGTRVLAATVLDLTNGKIVRQVNVQAWDE